MSWEYRILWFNRVTPAWADLPEDQRSYHNFRALLAPWQDVADYMNSVGTEGWEIFQVREVVEHNWDEPLRAISQSNPRSVNDSTLTFNTPVPTSGSEVVILFFYARRSLGEDGEVAG